MGSFIRKGLDTGSHPIDIAISMQNYWFVFFSFIHQKYLHSSSAFSWCFGNKRRKKNEKITWTKIYVVLGIGFVLFFLNTSLLKLSLNIAAFFISTTGLGYISLMLGVWISRLLRAT
jgi:Na+-driven multidrug efflux pump